MRGIMVGEWDEDQRGHTGTMAMSVGALTSVLTVVTGLAEARLAAAARTRREVVTFIVASVELS